jgi:hypothetical protein
MIKIDSFHNEETKFIHAIKGQVCAIAVGILLFDFPALELFKLSCIGLFLFWAVARITKRLF